MAKKRKVEKIVAPKVEAEEAADGEEEVDYEESGEPQEYQQEPVAGGEEDATEIEEEEPEEDDDEEDDDEEDITQILEPLSKDQLVSLLRAAALSNPNTLAEIHRLADQEPSQRKIFVHGIGWSTTADTLRSFMSQYGEIDECKIITDRATGKSKGYGFVLFRHRRSAQKALKEPQKNIDGRMTASQLASIGPTAPHQPQQQQQQQQKQLPYPAQQDTLARKIFVGNVHSEIDGSRLREFFSRYGEIEEGPLGFDRQTGKPKGFALFIYQTVEGARKALEEPYKNFEGNQLFCQKATTDGLKGKVVASSSAASSLPGNTGYAVPGNTVGFNGAPDMGMTQGLPMQFGQGVQANPSALALLAAAGQNPAAFGLSPALLASLNPALAAAMSMGGPPVVSAPPMQVQGYGMGNPGFQNMGYQAPPVQQNAGSYQVGTVGQVPAMRPPMGPMGGYRPH